MLLWLASLALASLTSLANGAPHIPLHVLAAPNKLRVGTAESIFVEIQDYEGSNDLPVTIKVLNHPTKTKELKKTEFVLTKQNKYQHLAEITIPAEDFNTDPNITQYVTVQAQFPGRTLEKTVLVSFQSGYIFIQTDKTIYTPNSRVNYRMFAVTPGMDPIQKGATSVTVEIKNPGGMTFSVGTFSLEKGIYSGSYQISDITSLGTWNVVAKFAGNPQESFTAPFEVRKYVLPTFEVKLKPEEQFFYVDKETFEVEIQAKYMYGEPVYGNAYVVFGFIQGDVKQGFLPVQFIPVQRGVARATLERRHITGTPDFDIYDAAENQASIYISVTVLTQSGSEMVESEIRGIRIVKSPYAISFKKTAKYFKPGVPLDLLVEVLNPDETPAVGVPVVQVTKEPAGNNRQTTTDENGLAKIIVNMGVSVGATVITVKTAKQGINNDRQTQASMTVQPYHSSTGNYLHLGVGSQGNDIVITFNFGKLAISNHDITYLILSRGQIVKYGQVPRVSQALWQEQVTVNKLMMPSFRVVAYYHASPSELVSDAVVVFVKETCMGSLKIELEDPQGHYEPHGKIRLKLTGDKGARVGMVAVDKAVYVLNNKHRLTQKKVWSVVERYDTGCTPGGGRDVMGVFFDAGLMFESSLSGALSGTQDRTDRKCPETPGSARRKRAVVNIAQARTSLLGGYTDPLERRCCTDGMRDIPLSYTCQRRTEYIQDSPECKAAFLHCCVELTLMRADQKDQLLHLARSQDFGSYDSSQIQITSRTDFKESWLWNVIDLPAECPSNVACDTTTYIDIPRKARRVPDSITTWQISGVSLSPDHGICVGAQLEVVVKKLFFVDLRLPYSAVRGEQIEIRAILHNLKDEVLSVILELYDTHKDVCSVASKRTKHRMWLDVGAKSTRSQSFIIIPMKEGVYDIEVKAIVPSLLSGDGIIRKLLVEPIGILTPFSMKVELDPAKTGGTQQEFINNTIPDSERAVPGGKTKTFIEVTGGNQMSSMMENALSGTAMKNFIRMPSGCGEQNIGHMTFPLITAVYLDKARKWQDVGFSRRNDAIEFIRKGYDNELAYRWKTGCFAIWAEHQSGRQCTTWLTAYVVKVFAMARDLVAVRDDVLCDAVKWLIFNTQQPDGIFKEVGDLYHPVMTGGLQGPDKDVSMTAFVLIAMQESRAACSNLISSMPGSINRAVAYLERKLPGLNNPYAVAITSYALANAGKLNKDILFRKSAPGRDHWPVAGGDEFTREATGYALLALVKVEAFEEAKPVVKWLNLQRLVDQGYGSTQVTMIVYQALAEYWGNIQEEPFDMQVQIKVAGRKNDDRWPINRANSYTTRSSKAEGIKAVNVIATGSGEATLTVVSLFYALPKTKSDECLKYNLSVNFKLEEKKEVGGDIYLLEIEIMYKDDTEDAKMTILDVGLPTGFTPVSSDLDKLTNSVDTYIQRYEIQSLLSETKAEKGSIMIYLNKVSHKRPDLIAFHVRQAFKVGVLQPAAVSVYEYYNRQPCTRYYHPDRPDGEILRLCQDVNTCVCAEESCSKQKKDKITDPVLAARQRLDMACQTQANNKTDYVYKVRVEHFVNELSTDTYHMRIEEALKQGTDKGRPPLGIVNALRSFVSFRHCRAALGLVEKKTYLIMGLSTDLYYNQKTEQYEYSIGERTWIEYWPTQTECQDPQVRPLCLALGKVKKELEIFGCAD